ncbi:MAG: hypothetical protein DMF76_17205 [Acidobacteria bacterium]|nr:MAG: hypothetical protein DMF76_17205 [Acidobacteriota bacterium]
MIYFGLFLELLTDLTVQTAFWEMGVGGSIQWNHTSSNGIRILLNCEGMRGPIRTINCSGFGWKGFLDRHTTISAIGILKAKTKDPSGKIVDLSPVDRYVGEDAERKVAVCCESWLANKNLSNRKTLNRSGRHHLWRPSLLSTRPVPPMCGI